jgi:hypothetical protein
VAWRIKKLERVRLIVMFKKKKIVLTKVLLAGVPVFVVSTFVVSVHWLSGLGRRQRPTTRTVCHPCMHAMRPASWPIWFLRAGQGCHVLYCAQAHACGVPNHTTTTVPLSYRPPPLLYLGPVTHCVPFSVLKYKHFL